MAADEALILHGGPIHTMHPALGRVEAVALAEGRIAAAGALHDVRRNRRAAREVDLGGRAVLPGLIDTHPHLLHYATLQAPLVDIAAARASSAAMTARAHCH
jgi:predicted amidohydrolase YtcJ